MSRDWTPLELYVSEQHQLKQGYGDLFDFMDGLKLIDVDDGKEEILHTSGEMAIRRQFPQLGRLLMDDFMELHERLSHISGGIDFLHRKDKQLADFIGAIRIGKHGSRLAVKIDDNGINADSYLVKWFTGRLDEHFYHCERNNEMFVECILSDAIVLNREPYDKERFEAALQYFSSDADVEENKDFFEAHANKLIYCFENKKDMLDFDFWVRYELLLGEKITWDEYVAIDNKFDGDPHDIGFKQHRIIDSFKESLNVYREEIKNKLSLDDNIKAAMNNKVVAEDKGIVKVIEER